VDCDPSSQADYLRKTAELAERVRALGSVLVAFSGGVDSSVLLAVAHRELGPRALGAIAVSPSLAQSELASARSTAAVIGTPLLELETHELSDPDYVANAGRRCYYCKRELFTVLSREARRRNLSHLAFGELADDRLESRPGSQAAREHSVAAPLAEAGFTKADVRRLARELDLPEVADKPAAPCLASRLPTHTPVTAERLARIERAEAALRDLGLRVLRVRDHGSLARVEVGPAELPLARSLAAELHTRLQRAGFERHELTAYAAPTPAARP
jgi:uncharacterized protein